MNSAVSKERVDNAPSRGTLENLTVLEFAGFTLATALQLAGLNAAKFSRIPLRRFLLVTYVRLLLK